MVKILKSVILIAISITLASMTFYDINFQNGKTGETINFSDFKGKVVMVVNTASLCGFAKQYGEMQKLWEKYRDKDFILIAVPTNDFMNQEPKSDAEIVSFCEINFGINFPITQKVTSKGKDIHPFFKYSKENFKGFSGPNWNFYKYIFDKEGNAIAWFSSFTSPNSKKIEKILEEIL